MLLIKMAEELKSSFPDLLFLVNEKDSCISIPAKNEEVGGVTIYDDSRELTVEVGNFTHWHASCYEGSFSEKEKINDVVSQVVDFLSDLFEEKIIMWRSVEAGGGFYNIEFDLNEQDSPLEPEKEDRYVWSGRVSS